MTKSIALYARVSSERQARQATIESQLAALRARATDDGCVVLPTDEYIDNGHSGSSLRRPALERLRDRVAQGAVETIHLHSPDRLARRHAHQVLLLDEFARHGVRVMMLEGRNSDSAEDQLLVQVQGVIAERLRSCAVAPATPTQTARSLPARVPPGRAAASTLPPAAIGARLLTR